MGFEDGRGGLHGLRGLVLSLPFPLTLVCSHTSLRTCPALLLPQAYTALLQPKDLADGISAVLHSVLKQMAGPAGKDWGACHIEVGGRG